MKKFELVIKDGRRVVYKSTFTFSESQEKEYLKKVSECGSHDNFYSELEAVVVSSIGEKAWNKDYEKWNNMNRKKCVLEYPDYAIAAHLMTTLYDKVTSGQDVCLDDLPQGVEEEIQIAKMPSLEWFCKRIV